MTTKEKLTMLEEMLEMDEGTINEEMGLDEIDEWDSMALLSFSVLIQDEFGKKVTATEVKKYKTVKELLEVMEA